MRRLERSDSSARREASDGAKHWTAPVISTTRRPDNGDDGRLGRRSSAPRMTTIASDGGGSEKRLWL